MNKQISTILGILIVVLVAGATGVSVMLFNQELEKEVILKEGTFIGKDEIVLEEDPEIEVDEKIEKETSNADDFADWNTYRNKEYGFEFKVPPLFEDIGCAIEEGYSDMLIQGKDCGYVSFMLTSVETEYEYKNLPEIGEKAKIAICPQLFCEKEDLKRTCDALMSGESFIDDDPLFMHLVAKGDNYFIFSQGGPSHGDFYFAMGWENKEIEEASAKMESSYKFIDNLSEEEKEEWMNKEDEVRCDYEYEIIGPLGYL